jgi:signal transduction histidine kinase
VLHQFLTEHRGALIQRCRARVSARRAPVATPAELEYGIPIFLDQLTGMLARDAEGEPKRAGKSSDEFGPEADADATRHGRELLRSEFTIEQVVHDYGDLCQSITELAAEQGAPITVREFGILNIRLDNAIAGAVTEFARQQKADKADQTELELNERLGVVAHEMRNLLNTSILAVSAIKRGSVGFGGATAAALDRSLLGMRTLIDRTLADVRLKSGEASREVVEVGQFIAEVRVAAAFEAEQKGCALTVLLLEPGMRVLADRHILASAVTNLLQNAFKFTRPGSNVQLKAYASNGRVRIDVEDECGGLAEGAANEIFMPFRQQGRDRSGVGLGLSLSREGIEAQGGTLSVRSVPGKGCIFTIDLPRAAEPSTAARRASRSDHAA